MGQWTKWLNFGGDPDQDLDTDPDTDPDPYRCTGENGLTELYTVPVLLVL